MQQTHAPNQAAVKALGDAEAQLKQLESDLVTSDSYLNDLNQNLKAAKDWVELTIEGELVRRVPDQAKLDAALSRLTELLEKPQPTSLATIYERACAYLTLALAAHKDMFFDKALDDLETACAAQSLREWASEDPTLKPFMNQDVVGEAHVVRFRNCIAPPANPEKP